MAGQDELVRAAAEARAKTAQAHEGLTHTHDTCEQKKTAIAALQPKIDADRAALIEALEELGRATGEAATRLGNAVTQASGSIVELDELADGIANAAPRLLAGETGALDDAKAALGKIDAALAQSLESVETAHKSAFDRVDSAAHRLEEETQRVDTAIKDGAAAFTRGKEKLETVLHDALALLEHTIPEALTKRAAEWQQRKAEILVRAEETFTAMLHHVEEVTANTAAKLGSTFGAEREARAADAHTVATELTALARSLDSRRGELEATLDHLAERMTTEHDALHTLDGHLEAVRGRWATFGFSA